MCTSHKIFRELARVARLGWFCWHIPVTTPVSFADGSRQRERRYLESSIDPSYAAAATEGIDGRQHAHNQQQGDDHSQTDAVDGEGLIGEVRYELQESDDHDVAEYEADDHGYEGRPPAGEHRIGFVVLHGLDGFEQT